MARLATQPEGDSDNDVDCPNCGESIKADAILCRFCDMGLSKKHFRECPSCAEMIRRHASSCRFCKTTLNESPLSSIPQVKELRSSGAGAYSRDARDAAEIAQSITSDIIEQLRKSRDTAPILQSALERVTDVLGANRGLIWKIDGDQLAVANEYSISGFSCFAGNQLGPQESTAIVYEFLSRFPDELGTGVISVPDTYRDTNLHKMSQTLCSLIELGDTRARLLVQLRSRGIFHGFLEVQQSGCIREWTTQDSEILQKVAEVLSVVVQQSSDQSKIENDARDMQLLDKISMLYRDTSDCSSQKSLTRAATLVAEHMRFSHSQVYLYEPTENVLKPQLLNEDSSDVDMSMKDNPFANVFSSGRVRVINAEFTRKGDSFFLHETALLLPLISRGECLGVIAWWGRLRNSAQFRPSDRALGMIIATSIAQALHIDRSKS